MKNIKNMALSGAAMLLAAAAFNACTTEGNDWEVDPSYERLFHVTQSSLSVTPAATSAEVSFSKTPNTSYYIMQISKDSLYDDMDESAVTLVTYGGDGSIVGSPYVLENLIGDSKYYFRMKGCSNVETTKDSYWVYLKKGYFKTKAEQIMYAVGDDQRGEDFILLTWIPGMEVTHLMVHTAEVEEDVRIDLDAAAIAAGQYKLTGLKPSTSYTITIWYNDAQRGSATASTFAAAPQGDYIYRADASLTKIDNELISQIAEEAKAAAGNNDAYSATIVIPAGLTIDMSGVNDSGEPASLKLPEGMSVTFFGAPGEQPTVKLTKSINIAGGHAYIRFENLKITDGGCQYFINQSADCAVGELGFKSCQLYNFERSVVRGQGAVVAIEKIAVDDCIFTNMSTGNGYSVFYAGDAKNQIKEIALSNSTFDTAQRSFIEASKSCISKIGITNCTLYNLVETGRYFIDANGQNTNIELNGIILGKTHHADAARGVRTNGTVTVVNSIRTSDCIFASNDFKAEVGFPAGEQSSADIFTDPENHNFTLKISDQVGDPRWYRSEE